MQSLAVASLAAVTLAQQLVTDAPSNFSIGAFGVITEEREYENEIHKILTVPNLPYVMDYPAQTRHLEYLTKKSKAAKLGTVPNDEPFYKCDERHQSDSQVFSFLPAYNGFVSPSQPKASFTGACWDFDVTYVPVDDTHFDLLITTSNRQSTVCSDNLFIANTEIKHIESFYFKGDHRLSFTIPLNGQADLEFGGLKLYHFCSGFKGEIESVFHTLEAFVGGVSDHPFVPFVGSHHLCRKARFRGKFDRQ